MPHTDRRHSLRMDAFALVRVETEEHGAGHFVARNVSEDGIFLETRDPLPLGSALRIWFTSPDSRTRVCARGEVKNHYHLHFGQQRQPRALTGMGVRFTGFEDPLASIGALVPRRRDAVGH
ncbi:MAG: PilZ domain-containing protein [Proteobacteria bacterium]|nr:PilZ domain-containing protein [Pseudomonadota bacterium]